MSCDNHARMPSHALLRSLPFPDMMKARLRTFAMLDAIVAPEFRSFEFHPQWGKHEQMGAFKDGEGNFFFAWFSRKGAVLRGFDHESKMSPFQSDPPKPWPGIWEGLPEALANPSDEQVFSFEGEITFACWAVGGQGEWKAGPVKPPKGRDVDGAEQLLACFKKNFRAWADDYYGRKLDGPALTRVWWGREVIDRETLEALNPDFDEKMVKEEAKLLGFKLELSASKGTKRARGKTEPAVAKPSRDKLQKKSFGEAEFVVRCEPTRVRMLIHGKQLVAQSKANVYNEIFEWVAAKLKASR